MELNEFIRSRGAAEYDFSNDGADAAYVRIDNISDTYRKFFSYMAVHKRYVCENGSVMQAGAAFSAECCERMPQIPDPDSGSLLLREIYKALWDDKYLAFSRREDGISGETLFSQNTTLCELYKNHLETREERREREAIVSPKQGVSVRYILSRYAENERECAEKLDTVRGLKRMLAIYHTLGNFMPFPNGCNSKRGTGLTKDYPDLLLYIVYQYYVRGIDRLAEVVGSEKHDFFRSWLELYGEDVTGWCRFIETNFLQDLVGSDGCGYGVPLELWRGHFDGGVLPASKQETESFYSSGASMIAARTNRMLTALQNTLNA